MAVCPTCGRDAGAANFCAFDGTPLAHVGRGPAGMPDVGDVVDGRYRLLEELGRGGMAIVFLARAEALDRDVALKVLYPRWAENEKQIARFAREARAASQIDHDAVVKVYDFGWAPEGFYFLAMERLEGEPLEALLQREGALRPHRALRVLGEIASGVARAHELGVIHRDLKPENVMVRRARGREAVTIVDFGLSKIQEGEAPVTAEGDVIGTPDYMAPEQWMGKHVDARVDVYALGVIAYQMLCGEPPFGGETLIEKLQQHLHVVPLELKDHPRAPALPAGLSDLVARCMAKDPLDRPPHMGPVARRLRELEEAIRDVGDEPAIRPTGPAAMVTAISHAEGAGLDRIGLIEEVRRLSRVRQQRLRELAPRVFGATRSGAVGALEARIEEAEAALSAAEEDVALAEAALGEARRANRSKEAELRAELVAANLELAVTRDALPSDVADRAERPSDTLDMSADTTRGSADDDAGGDSTVRALDAARRAEARLAAFVNGGDASITDAETRFDRATAAQRDAEAPIDVLYEELERVMLETPGADTRPLVELAPLDGLLETYRTRLELLARHEARASR